jgi:polysaccharide chain length determinant protein (PEP-CTERM system associated)
MLGQRELGFDDYMAILRRRLWVLVIPALVGPVVAFLVTLVLTPDYTSESLILIEQPKVPESFVKSVVTSDLVGRLATMEEQILSRTRLQPIIERYGLYRKELRRGVPMEDVIDEMRKAILVTPVDFANPTIPGSGPKKIGGKNAETVPGFSISFTAENARLAEQVCSDLTSMFMEENLRQREQRAQGTTTFLHTQLEEAKTKLDEADAKLADFKRRNIGVLPDEQQTNLQVLGSLNTQLASVTEDLNRAHQEKIYAESMLNQQLAAWKASQSGAAGDSQTQTLQQQLTKLQDYLVALEARYTSDHPDVIKTKADIAQLQKEIEEQAAHKDKPAEAKPAEAKPTEASLEPNAIQQLRAVLREQDERIRQKTADQEHIQQQINSYQGRLQISPAVEQQFKDITRDYQTALQFYNSLLAKTDESQMSTDLERRQEGEQFQVLDSANLPQDPSFPIWWEFALGGLGAGVLIGLAIILVQELRDKAIRDERDIELYLELETLALVPFIERSNGGKRRIFKRGRKQEVLPEQVAQT